MSTGYVLGLNRGHNAGTCLLKDGQIVFAIEEDRISRFKYDGAPLASILKVLDYTDKVDKVGICYTDTLDYNNSLEFSGDELYAGYLRKLGLIDRDFPRIDSESGQKLCHPQIYDFGNIHHEIHAACGYFRSEWEEAAVVVMDGCGSNEIYDMSVDGKPTFVWQVETIFDATPRGLVKKYQHRGTDSGVLDHVRILQSEQNGDQISLYTSRAGVTKCYEAITELCGFSPIDAGKTMGLASYGELDEDLPKFFEPHHFPQIPEIKLANKELFIPTYPNSSMFNFCAIKDLLESPPDGELTKNPTIRKLARQLQHETQEQLAAHIRMAVRLTGKNKVVLVGGYGLNCVANYHILDEMNKEGIEVYCEPAASDCGLSMGAAFTAHLMDNPNPETAVTQLLKNKRSIYLGLEYSLDDDYISQVAEKYGAVVSDGTDDDVVELMCNKNIVAYFQGRSEIGPRALGNRSLLFDPTFKDGKDFVNTVKQREYFRPFAGSILLEDVHDWFDMKGLEETPAMMYAVNCQPGVEKKIPSIIHVDGTCRIQTVSAEQNPLYHRLITKFKARTGTPIVFNTSFNLGGEPLVETLEDAINTLASSDIEYLYLPEYGKLISVPNSDE